MNFIDDQPLQRSEELPRLRMREHQRELLGRGQQDIRRRGHLPGAARGRGIARARLDADGQVHLRRWRFKIARDIDCQRLQRRDVERMQPPHRARLHEVDQAREEPGERLAGSCGRNQQGGTPRPRLLDHRKLVGAEAPTLRREPVGDCRGQLSHRARAHKARRAPARRDRAGR